MQPLESICIESMHHGARLEPVSNGVWVGGVLAGMVSEGEFLTHSWDTWQSGVPEACVHHRRQPFYGWGSQA